MPYRLIPLVLIAVAIALAGCGGGGETPVQITGEYFPLTPGATWTYSTQLEVETTNQSFETTGTFTRTMVGKETIDIDGQSLSAFAFDHVYTAAAMPDIDDPRYEALNAVIDYLFAPDGGLQPVRAYYLRYPGTAGLPTNLQLAAIREGGSPVQQVPTPRAQLFNPPYQGTAQYSKYWFMPMPLMPSIATLSNFTVHDKVLNYGVIDSPLGPRNQVVSIYYYQGNMTVGPYSGAISGRGRNYFQEDIGFTGSLEPADWYATLDFAGIWARVTSRVSLTSYDPGEGLLP